METNKKWSLTPVLNPSLPDTPENTETQWGLSFRCPPIPCCWDLKPSHVPGEINIPTICLPAQPNSSCEAPGRWHSETVSGAEHSERKHPKKCNFWGAEINKGNWNFFSSPYLINSSDASGYIEASELHIYSTFLHRMYFSETRDSQRKTP